jgi:hypothetical protein
MDKGIMLATLDSLATVLGSYSLALCGNSDVELSGFDDADCRSSNDITVKILPVYR